MLIIAANQEADGHLKYLDQILADTVFSYVAMSISQTFTNQYMLCLDFWPFKIPVLVVSNPHAADQIMTQHPSAGRIRMGYPDIILPSEDGTSFPTASCQVPIVHEALHRNPAYWVEPDSYVPDRWLIGTEDPLYPVKGAWSALEHGSRTCIGQNLALTEIRTILMLTLRESDVRPAYEEWDRFNPRKVIKTFRGIRRVRRLIMGEEDNILRINSCRIRVRGD
jgi:hypothetical protein